MSQVNSKRRTNSRRGTASSKFLRARSLLERPSGPYRPRRQPKPSKDLKLRSYWSLVFILALVFSLGQVWKAQQFSALRTNLETLRCEQTELEQHLLTLKLQYDEMTSYAVIEPLARETLGMFASTQPPVVIAPVDDRFFKNLDLFSQLTVRGAE
ncbi:cell division protein FtsL [bacterium]|nr:cell division protein FtsL [bacterium]MBU1652744.1 cell division protein FtsL [bacterium]MBU1882311.1 cell division protein FtsL [bacterium]